MKVEVPDRDEVVRLRESVQETLGVGITAAQDWCAQAVHTSRRAWQQWESGERRMHAAFWELAGIKVKAVAASRSTTKRGSAAAKRGTGARAGSARG